MPPEEIPLFELPLVVLPTELVPLHIFEERYKRMFEHCRSTDSTLAILLRTDAGASAIGCAAEVTEVLEEFDDGRLNVVVTGLQRVRIVERRAGPDFPLASVEPVAEAEEPDADAEPALAAFRRLLEAVGSDQVATPQTPSAYAIAARVELPVDVKQSLLESGSESARLELIERALDELAEQAIRSRKLGELASGNGHAGTEIQGN